MRSLKLSFPYRRQQVSPLVDYILLFLGAVLLVSVVYQLKLTMEKTADWETREAAYVAQQQRPKTPGRTPAVRVDQATQQDLRQAGDILRQLNLPWETLFDSLELAASRDVSLLSLQPSVASRTVRISGEARNLSSLVEYVEALEREVAFKNAHLINYKVRQDHPHHPVTFLVAATWLDSL